MSCPKVPTLVLEPMPLAPFPLHAGVLSSVLGHCSRRGGWEMPGVWCCCLSCLLGQGQQFWALPCRSFLLVLRNSVLPRGRPELKSLASDEQEAAGPTYLRSEFLLRARHGVEGMAWAGLRGLAFRFWPP